MTTTAVQEKPIVFSAPMVQAILDGRKTQTRRIVKPQPIDLGNDDWKFRDRVFISSADLKDHLFHDVYGGQDSAMPYGGVYEGYGDRLWVRERIAINMPVDQFPRGVAYWATDAARCSALIKWRPSIHMPRWASRLTLELTNVRVERVQDISAKDILAEGAVLRSHHIEYLGKCPISAFDNACYPDLLSLWSAAWEKVNGKGAWKRNDWTWVLEFRRVEPAR